MEPDYIAVKQLMNNVIEAIILKGKYKGEEVSIPRIPTILRITPAMDNINSTKMQGESELSKIQSFYTDTTVFLTGATGFMGNLILEKLIRTCSGVKKVYILVREKKGKTAEERFKELFEDYIFSVMKKEQPDYLNKISAIIGDCSSPNLGIAEKDQEILKNEVNIIIHCAATVKFDEHLRIAVNINILALQDLLKLGQKIKNLKAFVHISTAYSNCAGRKVVDEVFYKPPISGDSLSKVCQSLDDSYITEITPIILREWPNTYALTKAIAEGEILIYGKGLPVGIIRPSMIVATDKEPLLGWINNVYGPTGIIMATGIGVVRVTLGKHNGVADIIPGDIVSNAVLASAWDIHNQWLGYKIWPIMMRITSNKYEYMVLRFLLHTLPGLLIDLLAVLIGKKPKLTKSYKKIHKFVDVLSYFSMRSWTFNDDNTRSLIGRMSKLDQSLFNFDISNLNWDDYFKRHVEGLVKYLLKDTDEDSLEKGRKHMRRLYMIHYILTVMLAVSFFLILYGLIAWFV